MVMLIGCTAPAPSPCTARATISAGMLQAIPHSTDPTRNSPMPKSITGLRPDRVGELAVQRHGDRLR